MLRVRSATDSLAFYQDVMGMELLRTIENENSSFNIYFLAYTAKKTIPDPSPDGVIPLADQEGLLELTWNYGTEDANFSYHNGNDQPQGFGHICVTVDDLDKACARFDEKGVKWKKRLTEGKMKNLAFLLDPDGYWIELYQNETLEGRGRQ
jgi:lactoylglutathione lyase